MIGKYKDFYHYIKCINSSLIDLWEEFNNRKDPEVDDKFNIMLYDKANVGEVQYIEAKFVKVMLDSDFKNGVAFYYIFNYQNNEIKVHSINDVYDPSKLSFDEKNDLFAFWRICIPIE